MGGGSPSPGGPPINCQIFTTLYWRLNVRRLKKSSTFWGKKSALPEKILATHMRKGPPPHVGMGSPEWLIRPWIVHIIEAKVVKPVLLMYGVLINTRTVLRGFCIRMENSSYMIRGTRTLGHPYLPSWNHITWRATLTGNITTTVNIYRSTLLSDHAPTIFLTACIQGIGVQRHILVKCMAYWNVGLVKRS